jgi:Glutamine amidotransferase domain
VPCALTAEVSDLATAFESLRGQGKRFSANAGEFARVGRINATDESDIQSDGNSWVASYGLLHHDGPLLKQPVEKLDGQFALVSFDAETKVVQVATDPLGFQALYVAERDGKTYVSTSVLRARPSRLGIEAFLCAGYQFGRLTNWEGIERLEPGQAIRFTERERNRYFYWRPAVDPAINKLGFKEAADHLIEVATETFRSYLGDRTVYCTNLTGGYDSRLLNLLLRRAGVRFRTNTRGDADHPDVRISKEIAQETGWEWLNIRLPADWPSMLPNMIAKSLAWGDAHLDAVDLASALWQPPEIGNDAILLNGGGGELTRNFCWRQEFWNVGRSTQVNLNNWVNMRLIHPIDTSVFAGDPMVQIREDFGRRMTEWARPYSQEVNTIQLDMMYAYKMTGHFGLYGPAFGAYGLVQSPLALALPVAVRGAPLDPERGGVEVYVAPLKPEESTPIGAHVTSDEPLWVFCRFR